MPYRCEGHCSLAHSEMLTLFRRASYCPTHSGINCIKLSSLALPPERSKSLERAKGPY